MVDDYLAVRDAEGSWAAVDVCDIQANRMMHANDQTGYITDAVTFGKSRGTSQFRNFTMPSLMIWQLKCRTLFVETMVPLVNDSA
jgi:hypothetical protein